MKKLVYTLLLVIPTCYAGYHFLIKNNKQIPQSTNVFKSEFNSTTQLSSIYDIHTQQDWTVDNNILECIVSKKKRSIKLNHSVISESIGNLEMTVCLGFFETHFYGKNNWAGFQINNDRGSNINMGVSSNGSLFIGTPNTTNKNTLIRENLSKGIYLNVKIHPNVNTNNYTINLSVTDSKNNKILASITKNDISQKQLKGTIYLMSDFNTTNKNVKSVWFKDWVIEGSKLASAS